MTIEHSFFERPAVQSFFRNQHSFQIFVETASHAIIVINSTGKIEYANESAAKLHLCNRDELIGQPAELLIPERLREQYQQYIGKTPLNNHQNTHTHRLDTFALRSDGSEIPVDINLNRIEIDDENYLISFISEISRRKEVENALRESEARYRGLFEDDLTGNFIMDGQGNILMCNPAFAKLFGFENPRVAQYSDFMERFTDDEARTDFIEEIHRQKKLALYEITLRKTNGKLIYVLANLVGNFNDAGKLTGVKGYLLDISRRREIEAQFLQAQKMESLGILAGSIAHDFSNFVSVIEGYAEIILMKMDETDPMRNFVEKIQQTNKQAGLLIKQIQAFSRRQEALLMRIDPNYAIREIKEILDRLIGKKINFQLHCGVDIGTIIADPVQLEQAIMNLAVNARDAMPNGGTLTVRTYRTKLGESDVLHSEAEPGEFVCIEIQDTGIGMDEETKSHIFEPFFTTKPRGKGTGLGLSTVYGIIKQSHGHISVISFPEKGTTFRMFFPIVPIENAESV